MSIYKLRNDKLEICPFDPVHQVKTSKLQIHIGKCPRNPKYGGVPRTGYPLMDPKPCIFNATHYVPLGTMNEHLAGCPSSHYDVLILVKADEDKPEGLNGVVPLAHHPIADNGEVWEDPAVKNYLLPALAGKPVSEDPNVPMDKIAYQRLRSHDRREVEAKRTSNMKELLARRELAERGVTFEEPSSVTSSPPESTDESNDSTISTIRSSECDGSDSVFLDGRFQDYGIRKHFDISKAFKKTLEKEHVRVDSQATTCSVDDEAFETSEEALVGSDGSLSEDETLKSPDYTPYGKSFHRALEEHYEAGYDDSEDGEEGYEDDGMEFGEESDATVDEADFTVSEADVPVMDAEVLDINEADLSSLNTTDSTIQESVESVDTRESRSSDSISSIGSSASHSERDVSRKSNKRKILEDIRMDSGFATRRKKRKSSKYAARSAIQTFEDSNDFSF